MRVIAHRGNILGPESDKENTLYHIGCALDAGYEVEVDLWKLPDGSLKYGHDSPSYDVDKETFLHPEIIYHCKNIEAYMAMRGYNTYKPMEEQSDYFIHTDESIIRTNSGLHWVHPEHAREVYTKAVSNHHLDNFIVVMPEFTDLTIGEIAQFGGICTDYSEKYSDFYGEHYI